MPRERWKFTVELTGVLDLTDEATLESLGIDPAVLIRDDVPLTREIGESAHDLGSRRFCRPLLALTVSCRSPENLAEAVLLMELLGIGSRWEYLLK